MTKSEEGKQLQTLKKLENSTYVYRNNKVDDTLVVVTNVYVHVYRNLSRRGYILGCIVITAQLKLKLQLTEQLVT